MLVNFFGKTKKWDEKNLHHHLISRWMRTRWTQLWQKLMSTTTGRWTSASSSWWCTSRWTSFERIDQARTQVGSTDTMEEMRIAFRCSLLITSSFSLKPSSHQGFWHGRWWKDLQRRVPRVHAQLWRALLGGGHRADDQAGRPRRQRSYSKIYWIIEEKINLQWNDNSWSGFIDFEEFVRMLTMDDDEGGLEGNTHARMVGTPNRMARSLDLMQ